MGRAPTSCPIRSFLQRQEELFRALLEWEVRLLDRKSVG